jgi:uncharacterized protein YceK
MARLAVCGAALAVLMSGCGTAANTLWFIPEEGGKRVYGGVQVDANVFQESVRQVSSSEDLPTLARALRDATLTAVDLPLSAVADTLTLPITIPASVGKDSHSSKGQM